MRFIVHERVMPPLVLPRSALRRWTFRPPSLETDVVFRLITYDSPVMLHLYSTDVSMSMFLLIAPLPVIHAPCLR